MKYLYPLILIVSWVVALAACAPSSPTQEITRTPSMTATLTATATPLPTLTPTPTPPIPESLVSQKETLEESGYTLQNTSDGASNLIDKNHPTPNGTENIVLAFGTDGSMMLRGLAACRRDREGQMIGTLEQ